MHIVLASASPRRKELMEMLGAPGLRIDPAKGGENPPEGVGPEELVKPHSREEAIAMLETLSGRTHEVYTGVTVIRGGVELSEAERSLVSFRALTRGEIEAYVACGEPMDKAGAYGAQGKGALFVRRIEGDFFNVMGLPLCRLGAMLRKQGVELL